MQQEPFPHNGQDIINDLDSKLQWLGVNWEQNVLTEGNIAVLRYPDQGVKQELTSAYQRVMNANPGRVRNN